MGYITRTSIRDTAVDFSYPYFYDSVGFLTKKPSQIPNFMAILMPYSTNVWIAFSVALPIVNIIDWIISKTYRMGFCPSFNLGKVILRVSHLLYKKGRLKAR